MSVLSSQLVKDFNFTVDHDFDDLELLPGSIEKQGANRLYWLKSARFYDKFKNGFIIIAKPDFEILLSEKKINSQLTHLLVDGNQRLIFAKVIAEYFEQDINDEFDNYVSEHRKNPKIKIGENVFIGKNVEIGDGTLIHHNVVIYPRTRVGKNCVIKTHVSLGTEGLGLELNKETDEFVKFPQLGGVILEDNVEIGPCSTVRRSALDDTLIRKGTKIGSLVNIGHNCIIGRNCILTCQIVTSGSSVIGDNVYMGVNSIVKNGVNIGSNVTIGQGAVVTRNVPDGVTCVGNPAEDLNEYKTWSKLKKKLTEMFGKDL
jgi:UDP-3-O-[3-hydroxymyristoyl] glucosamine N-acyltransferase